MRAKAEVIKLKTTPDLQDKNKRLQLASGRQIIVDTEEKEERLLIVEPEGEISMTIRMTEKGPVIALHGTRLELKAAESITLEAPEIKMVAQKHATVKSQGSLELDSKQKMEIHSDDEIRVEGKMIHLN